MNKSTMSRRTFLVQSGTALAGLALLNSPWGGGSFALQAGEEVIPWLDQPEENPVPAVIANQHTWEELNSWITPNGKFFSIAHYNRPEIDAAQWQLEIGGLVEQPLTFTLDEIKTLPRQEQVFTLECSGNNFFIGRQIYCFFLS